MLITTLAALAAEPLPGDTTAGVNTDLAMFSGLAGWLTPPIVAVINQPRWPAWARLTMTLVFCTAVAAATTALEGRLTEGRWVTSALIVATAAVLTYQTAWKRIAPAIEASTSPTNNV